MNSQAVWDPRIISGATLVEYQTGVYSGSTRTAGLIAVATSTSVTIEWYGAAPSSGYKNSYVAVIHTDNIKNCTYSIEKSCTTSMSSKTITDLKVGDIIIGNGGNDNNAANNINKIINGAPITTQTYAGQAYIVIKDTADVYFSGNANSYTVVAFRQQ